MSKKSLAIRAAVLSAVVLVAAGIAIPFGWLLTRNLWQLSLPASPAAAICWFAALLAMAVGDRLRTAGHVMAFLTVATTIRMGIPLFAVVAAVFFRTAPRRYRFPLLSYCLLPNYPCCGNRSYPARSGWGDRTLPFRLPTASAMEIEELANHVADTMFFHFRWGTTTWEACLGFQITKFRSWRWSPRP